MPPLAFQELPWGGGGGGGRGWRVVIGRASDWSCSCLRGQRKTDVCEMFVAVPATLGAGRRHYWH